MRITDVERYVQDLGDVPGHWGRNSGARSDGDRSGDCGRVGGGGSRGCPTNPTPLTVSFTIPGRDDAVAVSVTALPRTPARPQWSTRFCTRLAGQDLEHRLAESTPANARGEGYILASEARRQDGSLLVFENLDIPEWTSPRDKLSSSLVRPEQPSAPTGHIPTGRRRVCMRSSKLARPRLAP